MATRSKAPDTAPATEGTLPRPRTYMVRLTVQTTMEWGSTLDLNLDRPTIERLLRGEAPTLRVSNGAHPMGQARYVTWNAIMGIDIIGGWDDTPTPGETAS